MLTSSINSSSVYTWHVQRPDGTWEPFTFGTSSRLYPQTTGTYTIYLREDNNGLSPEKFGSTTVSQTLEVNTLFCAYQVPNVPTNEQLKIDTAIKIFPNPASDQVTFEFNVEVDDVVYAIVRDINGRLVRAIDPSLLREGHNVMTLDIANWENGVYTLQIMENRGIRAKRFIIQQ